MAEVKAENPSPAQEILHSTVQELQKTDQFNVRVALRRALDANKPDRPTHWHNPHTGHSGAITLLDKIRLKDDGQACVQLLHEYRGGESFPIQHKTVVCRDGAGNWNDTKSLDSASVPTYLQLYAAETVYQVQKSLMQLGYSPGSVDGVFGDRTQQAIKKFERNAGLPVTGIVTAELSTLLQQLVLGLQVTGTGETTQLTSAESTPRLDTRQTGARADLAQTTVTDVANEELRSAPVRKDNTLPTTVEKPADRVDADMSGSGVDPLEVTVPPTPLATGAHSSASSSTVMTTVVEQVKTGTAQQNSADSSPEGRGSNNQTSSILDTVASAPRMGGHGDEDSANATGLAPAEQTERRTMFTSLQRSFMREFNQLVSAGRPGAAVSPNALIAVAGLVICIALGLVAGAMTSRTRVPSPVTTEQSAQAERELDSKIAMVTGQYKDRAAVQTKHKSTDINLVRPPLAERGDGTAKDADAGSTRKGAATALSKKSPARSGEAERATGDGQYTEATTTAVDAKPSPAASPESLLPATGAAESIAENDEFEKTLQAIKEAEELIGRAQQLLRQHRLDVATQAALAQAIYLASKLLKDAVAGGPVEGPSDSVTVALQDASGLIRVALDKTSQTGVH